ncbi:hypothetical protein M404DRAFT_877983 [Pisolithus tinctorius Marx 270]|uniref:Uncharacterized protein n=1 Tax=Pisolithus tinctorius Marx 270 TaxID=870435 RepID=A0A0C3PPJ2_PISTI|nr:hypothetical protein M404DRAFT_877983 [Pisolithus tinctorius Marx 270]
MTVCSLNFCRWSEIRKLAGEYYRALCEKWRKAVGCLSLRVSGATAIIVILSDKFILQESFVCMYKASH